MDVLGPLTTQVAPAIRPAEPGTSPVPAPEGAAALGFGRGADLCIFNKVSDPITVAFDSGIQTQGSLPIAPGGWYCGYDQPDFFGFALVHGWIRDIPGEPNRIRIGGTNTPGVTETNIWVYSAQDPRIQICVGGGDHNEGEFNTLDTGNARFVLGRYADDSSWKYLYINVEPSQGVSPECARA